MKKTDAYKVLSALTGASVLLAGCAAPAVVQQAPEQEADAREQAAASAAELEGVTYSNGIAVETFVAQSPTCRANLPSIRTL